MFIKEMMRYLIPLIAVIIIVTSVIIFGLASQNPDGFEWSFFHFAGISFPTGGFEGIWGFLGESVYARALEGIIGISIVLVLGFVFFKMASRKTE